MPPHAAYFTHQHSYNAQIFINCQGNFVDHELHVYYLLMHICMYNHDSETSAVKFCSNQFTDLGGVEKDQLKYADISSVKNNTSGKVC